jgi:hypothetical protein
MNDTEEDFVWKSISADDIWILDKLILSRKLGYNCGPAGLDVPNPGYYIVRPCVNMMGLGLGAEKIFLEKETITCPLGYFWCEWFEGRHLSVDYRYGEQKLCVEGFKNPNTFTKWDEWIKTDDIIPLPQIVKSFAKKYEWINCEFIGGNLIEVHLRKNEDFDDDISHFIPVWQKNIPIPAGYRYKDYPDVHGRIGALVR